MIDAQTAPSLLFRLRDPDDGTAWQSFVDLYSPLVYNFCRYRKLQPSDAADVTQEVLLRVAKAMRKFEYDRSQGMFRDWLARIVQNEINRLLKKNAKAPYVDEENQPEMAGDGDWNDQFQQHIYINALEQCKPHFTEETWDLFHRTWVEKQSVQEVSKASGIEASKIYVARSRVLKRLKLEVTRLAEDFPF